MHGRWAMVLVEGQRRNGGGCVEAYAASRVSVPRPEKKSRRMLRNNVDVVAEIGWVSGSAMRFDPRYWCACDHVLAMPRAKYVVDCNEISVGRTIAVGLSLLLLWCRCVHDPWQLCGRRICDFLYLPVK